MLSAHGKPCTWKISLYENWNDTDLNEFPEPDCSYLCTLEGVVAYYKEHSYKREIPFSFNVGFYYK